MHHLIPAVEYDVMIRKDRVRMNLTVDLITNISGVVVIDDLSPVLSGISIPYFTPKFGYGLNVSAPIGGASLVFNYSGIEIDEDWLRVYECDDWNVTSRVCLGSWERINIMLDEVNDLIRFTVTSFSGFVVGESPLSVVNVSGIALDYYTGERVNGNITAIPLENPENKYTTRVVNGEWSMDFDILAKDVEHLIFVVEDEEKKGFNELKLPTPSTVKLNCTIQNISLSGYSLDMSGKPTAGSVKVSVLGMDYVNTTSFSGGVWSIELYPCLIPGRVYTLRILVRDNTGRRGEILQKYPAK